jgi:hypothetical protein
VARGPTLQTAMGLAGSLLSRGITQKRIDVLSKANGSLFDKVIPDRNSTNVVFIRIRFCVFYGILKYTTKG